MTPSQRPARFWTHWGLLTRIAALQSILLIVLASMMTSLLTYQHREEVLQDQQAKAQLLLLILSPLVGEHAVVGDYATIKQLLERQAHVYKDVSRLYWMRDGRVEVTVKVNPPLSRAPAWFSHLVVLSELRRATPIDLGGMNYGELMVSFDSTHALNSLWDEFVYYFWLSLAAALVLLTALLMVLRANLRVLKNLAGAADRFSQGELDVHIQSEGAQEIRHAAIAFNNMTNRIRQLLTELSDSQQQVREQLHFSEALIEAMPVPMFFKNSQGIYVSVNKAWERFFGTDRATVIGKTVHAIYPHSPETAALHEQMDAALWRDGGVQTYEMPIRTQDGRERLTMYSKASFADAYGETAGLIGIITDLTELKQAEQNARQALVEKSAAEESSRAKSLFLANMSHEIRTPLNGVLGLAQVGARTSQGRKAHETFNRILDAGQLLLSVVNDILDFSKLEAGKLAIEHEPFALCTMIDHAVDIIAGRAFVKGLDFQVPMATDLPERVVGDEMRLAQVLVNLLGNAVKFTERGRIVLSVHRADDQDGRAGMEFAVRDTGIGMTEEQISRLYQPFEQADGSTTRRFGGTGLGLSISQRLIEAMGGTIGVQSRPGEGSTFSVWLPIQAEDGRCPVSSLLQHIVLCGLPAEEAGMLQATLAERGVQAAIQPAETAFATSTSEVIVLTEESLQDAQVRAAATLAAERGQRLAVLVTPGRPAVLPEIIQETAALIERPLRACHLIKAISHPAPRKPAATLAHGFRLAGLRLLAAEDNEVNQIVLEEILAQEGARLTLANNGLEALHTLHERGEQAFDLVLTDIQMPQMDGYELASKISQLAPSLPVIGLSAHAMREERERSLAAGMREHISKPIDIERLVAAILRHALRRPGADVSPVAQPAPPEPTTTGETADEAIDWPALHERFKGRAGLIDKLVATTLATHRDTPARLRAIVTAADFDQLAFLAHNLKGMGGNLMAGPLHRLGGQTETSARSRQADAFALAEQLAAATEALLAALQARSQPASEEIR